MAVEKKSRVMSYEETRKQRVEENKRRMEELGLMDLSKDLKALKQKNPTKKPAKRKMHSQDDAGLEARRSSRVAAKPAVSYKDQDELLPGMRARFGNRERQGLPRRYLSDTVRMAAIEAAEEVFKDIKNPAFVKPMLHSHVSSCFWLGLPVHFCKNHMPLEDERFILETENGKEWECLYLAHKTGMSGGWRGFSLDQELVDGDCCIFELVSPLRFKVHFFRCEVQEDGSEEADEEKTTVKTVGKETTNEKKASKAVTMKKAGLSKARKLSKSSSKKLESEDKKDVDEEEEADDEDDDGDDFSPKLSKKDADTPVAGRSRASRGKQKDNKPDGLIDLESSEDEDEHKDARKAAAVAKSNQAGSEVPLSGRSTRNSLRRSLPPK